MATGAGKTYTACLAAYRLLAFTPMKRILFLVDRNNLGKQAEGEFGMFRLTENGDPFNTIYTVNRLKSAKVPSMATGRKCWDTLIQQPHRLDCNASTRGKSILQ